MRFSCAVGGVGPQELLPTFATVRPNGELCTRPTVQRAFMPSRVSRTGGIAKVGKGIYTDTT